MRFAAVLVVALVSAAACQSQEGPRTRQDSGQPVTKRPSETSEDDPEGRASSIFMSVPSGAVCTVDGIQLGITPCAAVLPNKKKVTVVFEKRGYRKETYVVERDSDGWASSYTYPLRR